MRSVQGLLGASHRNDVGIVDFFCGIGGFSLGGILAGMQVLAGVDVDPTAGETFEENFGAGTFIQADLQTEGGVRSAIGAVRDRLPVARPWLLIAGPPCQGFSVIGRRPNQSCDPRNKLFDTLTSLIEELEPPAFVIENVPGLLITPWGRVTVSRLLARLSTRYAVALPWELDASAFGVPQVRRRVFIAGWHRGAGVFRAGVRSVPPPTPYVPRVVRREFPAGVVPVLAAIGDLPDEPVSDGSPVRYRSLPQTAPQRLARVRCGEYVTAHATKKLTEVRARRIAALPQGGTQQHLPARLRTGGFSQKYRRLRATAPAPTLTAHMGKDLSDFIHPLLNRPITVREAARLQSFPDAFQFRGSVGTQFKHIGNALPPLLARSVIRHVVSMLLPSFTCAEIVEEECLV